MQHGAAVEGGIGMSDRDRELMERYIYQVVKRLPKDQRAEVALELRELIGDMAESGDAMEEVLTQLGDPAEFAEKYQDKSRHHQHFVRDGIEKFSEIGDQPARAGDMSVQKVGEACRHEQGEGDPFSRCASDGRKHEHHKGHDHDHSEYGQLIR